MRELQQAIKDAHERISSNRAVGIPGQHCRISRGLTFSQWYWLDKFGLAPVERTDDDQQWYGFILGYMPAPILAVQNEIYFSFPRNQIGVRNLISTETSPIILATQARRLSGRHYEDLVTGLILGLKVVGLPTSGELPRVETDKFKDFVRKCGITSVTNHTSIEL